MGLGFVGFERVFFLLLFSVYFRIFAVDLGCGCSSSLDDESFAQLGLRFEKGEERERGRERESLCATSLSFFNFSSLLVLH